MPQYKGEDAENVIMSDAVGYDEVDGAPALACLDVTRPRRTKTDRDARVLRAPLRLSATFPVKAGAVRLGEGNRRIEERFAIARDGHQLLHRVFADLAGRSAQQRLREDACGSQELPR